MSEPDHTGDGLWTDTFFDGLGREWQAIKEPNITRRTNYHKDYARIYQQSLWYNSGSPEYHTNTYDGANRVERETEPSGEFTDITYANGSVTRTDPLGKQRRTWNDADRKIIQVREWDSGVAQNTFFFYDALGNLGGVTDAAGNTASFDYDTRAVDRLLPPALGRSRERGVHDVHLLRRRRRRDPAGSEGPGVEKERDAVFRALDSEMDEFPRGKARARYAREYLDALDRKELEYLDGVRAEILSACAAIIDRFGTLPSIAEEPD